MDRERRAFGAPEGGWMDVKPVLDAVASCYEAVIDESLWPEAVDRIRDACFAHTAVINYFNYETGVHHDPYDLPDLAFTFFTSNLQPDRVANYAAKTAQSEGALYSEVQSLMRSAETGDLFLDTDLLPRDMRHVAPDDMRKLEPFATSIQSIDIFRRIGVVLNRAEPWRDILTVQFSKELDEIPDGAGQQLAMMAPYIARALNSGRMLTALRRRYAMVLEVLDRLAIGTAIVTDTREIVLKNTAFDRLLADGDALRAAADGRLRAVDPDAEGAFAHQILRAADCSLKKSLHSGVTTSLSRGLEKDPLSLDISPVRLSAFDGPVSRGYAIIFAIAPEWQLATNGLSLAGSFGLSKAEGESLTHYLKGYTYDHIADMRGVSRETVKSQIRSVLSKTNARNRTELARLVVAAHVPLLDN